MQSTPYSTGGALNHQGRLDRRFYVPEVRFDKTCMYKRKPHDGEPNVAVLDWL